MFSKQFYPRKFSYIPSSCKGETRRIGGTEPTGTLNDFISPGCKMPAIGYVPSYRKEGLFDLNLECLLGVFRIH